eukprot:scaffold3206_cov72-Phaeocystis_antarctica.AAC.1
MCASRNVRLSPERHTATAGGGGRERPEAAAPVGAWLRRASMRAIAASILRLADVQELLVPGASAPARRLL